MKTKMQSYAKPAIAPIRSFTSLGSSLLQRKCPCGGAPGPTGECEECRKKQQSKSLAHGVSHDLRRIPVVLQPKLTINQPGDRFEQEADRLADYVVSGRGPMSPSLSPVGSASVQREDAQPPAPKPDNYEAVKKILEAFQQTEVARQLKTKAAELGKDFLSSVEGKVIAGSALGGALAGIIASNSELPMQIPELPLDFIAPGLKAKLTWEGPVRSPTNVGLTLTSKSGVSVGASYTSTPAASAKPAEEKAGLTLTIPLGSSPAKPKSMQSASDKYRAETARIAAEQAKFREGLKTPEQKAEDKAFWDSYSRLKAKDPLNPLAQPGIFNPTERKKEEDLLQRKSPNESSGLATAPPIVHEVLAESGQPLDAATRGFMEKRFGHNFGHVRVHTDAKSAESARAVSAQAYTVGSHVVFASGQYQPVTTAGMRLLAHELAHTIQQAAAQGVGTDVSSFLPARVVTEPAILQRYAVPANLACDEVVDWLTSNSPYAPEWAATRCSYSFNGRVNVATSTLPDGTVKAVVKGHNKLSVGVDCPIDRPQWSPSRRPNRAAEVAAWQAMRATLDAHEENHRKIGATWRATLEGRWKAVDFTVTGTDKADAMTNAQTELDSRKQEWGDEAQAAQDAIDPFRGAVLACP